MEFMSDPYTDKDILDSFTPVVRDWWFSSFSEFSPPQKFSILNIHSRINTLVSSPTGSGKTLSAFAAILNELVGLSSKDLLEDKIYCVYISPLKALGNDIEKNLNEPLEQIKKLYEERYSRSKEDKLDIRVGVRTGDTKVYEKAKMLKKPPHILITTPESLGIVLTSPKLKEKLSDVQWVIVDEIHSLADSKRGVHLSLSLERLNRITNFCRIGLSATVAPLEEVAKFLVGYEDPKNQKFRPCKIVDVSYIKKLDLKVLSPVNNLITASYKNIYDSMYVLMNDFIQNHKTTLIFTNTRSATERIVHNLKDKFPNNYSKVLDVDEESKDSVISSDSQVSGKWEIGAHHGSLSQQHRLKMENRLKAGELKAIVSSTSLELGIDIGYIDLVLLLGSPKSVARALQRIGRSGHKLHEESVGRIIVLDRDDLVECSVLLKAATEKKIDKIKVSKNVFDVLAQQIFGLAIEDKINVDEVYNTMRKSYCYGSLERKDFDDVIKYLSGEYVSLEERYVYAKIWYDEETREIGKRGKMARVLYMTNIGTIPDETNVKVKLGNNYIGSISEPFLERLKKGDVFVLGGQTYLFKYAQGLTAFVESGFNRTPTVPSWFSEMLPLSFDLAMEIQKFRHFMDEYFIGGAPKKEIIQFINDYLYVDEYGANSIYEYFSEQYNFLEIPHDKKLIIEHYDDGNVKYIIFHALYGRRTNDVLCRALAFILGKLQGKDVELNISDDGFYLRVPSVRNVQISRAMNLLKVEHIDEIMKHALDKTEVLSRRFRHCAARSLMIIRNYKGRSKSVGKQQMSSRLLISSVKKIDNDFIILREARREVLEDLMDIDRAKEIIKDWQSEKIQIKEFHTQIPSPFAFNLISMGYSDIMKMEDKQEFLKRMHSMVLAKISLKEGKK
ncbi:ATP-dependent helicase [Candidatus Woesearchaeota archaeon]|nr:ATP-dependent helicase [Candidatus Woesearchaeota archaeon]MCF7901228.1 ATP-dependent helicase [Candidatus Woesearchaeota archaeon]MCF8013757.1 ATP-dependent helicase [Candidatus Woesearchaeota archaeon]